MKQGLRWYDSLFVLLFFYLLVLQVQAIWPFTVDDMFISLRYARNWAAGDGLLWNLNAPPVEGYSNFSFVVLGALALLLKINPVFILKAAGFVGLLGTCYFLHRLSRFWFSVRESLLPCIVLLLYKGQIIWAVSGLETTVYQALICGAVSFLFRGLGYEFYPGTRGDPRNSGFILAGICLSLAGLTRPETPALMVLFFVLICWDRPAVHSKKHDKGIVCFILAILIGYLPYFLWRLHYYGFLFPNSAYCKAFDKSFAYELDLNYLKFVWPFAVLAIPACIKSQDKRPYFLLLPSIIYLLLLRDADPVVAFYNRLFLPVFPLLLPLALQGLFKLMFFLCKKGSDCTIPALYFVTFLLLIAFRPGMNLLQYRYFSENPLRGEQLRMSVIDWLNEHSLPGNKVVLGDSGMIPYFSPLHFIDSYCLNNLLMAHYPYKQRYQQFCHKILAEKPDAIILTSLLKDGQVIYTPSDACLKTLLDKQNDYKLSKIFSVVNPDSEYRYEMFKNF